MPEDGAERPSAKFLRIKPPFLVGNTNPSWLKLESPLCASQLVLILPASWKPLLFHSPDQLPALSKGMLLLT